MDGCLMSFVYRILNDLTIDDRAIPVFDGHHLLLGPGISETAQNLLNIEKQSIIGTPHRSCC
jgi:hypothetical protein